MASELGFAGSVHGQDAGWTRGGRGSRAHERPPTAIEGASWPLGMRQVGPGGLPVAARPGGNSRDRATITRTLREVSTVEQPDEPAVRVYLPDEALKRAQPLPARDRLEIDDVSDEEWKAFQEALTDA